VRNELSEQLDVVHAASEHALVDRLLGGPCCGRHTAGDRPVQAALQIHPAGSVTPKARAGSKGMPASDHRDLARYHERTRRRGVNRIVYWSFRALAEPALRLYFRPRRTGREHIPDGRVILAANHRSFLDPFIIGICVRRPIYFVAKQELFNRRLVAWFLNCMGAFPIRRGESDEESLATALTLLERGEAVVIFPEGTRHRSGALHPPRRGVGRLTLESGAPVVPVAIKDTELARRGWRIRPVRVQLRCGRPLDYPRVERASAHLAAEVTARIWTCVELQWAWLGGPVRREPEQPAPREQLRVA
jgi:1-acyl-sn-glycerol-3-phosphate acyltransferase